MSIERIYLITIDCLRADYVGCIGGAKLTPNIDSLAKNSIVFTKAFANGPGTNQSFPAILTSTYFLMHGGMQLNQHYTTIAEVLRNKGFKTAAFHSNPFLSKSLGWSKGFNEFYDFMDTLKAPSAAVVRQKYSPLSKLIELLSKTPWVTQSPKVLRILQKIYYKISQLELPYLEGELTNKTVMSWIKRNYDKNFFLWIHYMDPHYPYIPPESYLTEFTSRKEAFEFNVSIDRQGPSKEQIKTIKKLYSGEVKYVDTCIGKLINFIKSKELIDNSLIILIADHGNAFMEYGKFEHKPDILYNEVLHVPLIIYGLNSSAKLEPPVQLLDIPPTITDALGFKKPNSFLGKSLLPQIEEPKPSQPIFSESAKPELINVRYDLTKKVVSCIKYPYKIILNELSGTTELYNIERDFRETKDLYNSETKICASLMPLIKKHLNFSLLKKRIRL